MDPKNFVLPISTLLDFEYKSSIQYFGPVIWYSIPEKIRNAKTMSSFKKKKLKMEAIKLFMSTLCRLLGWNWFYKH